MSVSNSNERLLIDRLRELKAKLDKAQKQAGILRTYAVHNDNRKDNNEDNQNKSDQ